MKTRLEQWWLIAKLSHAALLALTLAKPAVAHSPALTISNIRYLTIQHKYQILKVLCLMINVLILFLNLFLSKQARKTRQMK